MLARAWILSLIILVVAAYVMSQHRKLKFEIELEIEPKESEE